MVRYRWHLPCCVYNNGWREKSVVENESSNFKFYLTNVIWFDQFLMKLSTRLRYDLNYRFHHQIFIHIIIQRSILYTYRTKYTPTKTVPNVKLGPCIFIEWIDVNLYLGVWACLCRLINRQDRCVVIFEQLHILLGCAKCNRHLFKFNYKYSNVHYFSTHHFIEI